MGLLFSILGESIWVPLAALTGVVSVLDLGGMLSTVLTQLALFLVRTSSQGFMGDGVVQGAFCTQCIPTSILLVHVLAELVGDFL